VEEARKHVMDRVKFIPRGLETAVEMDPQFAIGFADFWEMFMGDGALPQKMKELMYIAIGVSHLSPACLVHAVAAIECGATDQELAESVKLGALSAGLVPNGPGMPYAMPYAAKVLEIAAKYRAGEDWEYITPSQFKMD
jgi:alkylhydroperoxidase/carboxymuconolactone decarboxylase family protein YurZ